MKKTNKKAISPVNRPQSPEAETTSADDVILDTASATGEAVESVENADGLLVEKVTKKPVSKSLEKKSKPKSTTKQSGQTVSRHKPVAPAEPVPLPGDDSLFSSATPNSVKEMVDQNDSPNVSTKPAKNFASSFSPSQNYQSVNQSSDRIAIFIDGSNLFYAASHLNIEVDYRRLLSSLVRGRRLLRAYFYTGVDPQNEKQRGFLLWLNRHGHRVVSKELTNLPDGSRKANMHVEMAVDMMRIAEYCPNITLLGGDGNLAYALEVLSQRGTFIEVVSLQSMTSDSLIDLADSYTDLADLRDDIKR